MSEATQTPEVSADTGVNTEAQTEAQAPSLSVNDLSAVAQIIDLAVQRGAFKAAEAGQVGQVFDKVALFVQSVQAANKDAAPAAEAPAS